MTTQVPVEIRFSAHARARYGERVRPSVAADALAKELQLLRTHGTITTSPPPWLITSGAHEPTPLYLTIDAITFPLRPADDHHIAVTCLTRGGLDPAAREHRNAIRRSRQRRRAAARRPLTGVR
jgi:hypothetical protein